MDVSVTLLPLVVYGKYCSLLAEKGGTTTVDRVVALGIRKDSMIRFIHSSRASGAGRASRKDTARPYVVRQDIIIYAPLPPPSRPPTALQANQSRQP